MSMITKEKIIATRKLLRKGIPEGEIKNQLLEEGFTQEDIKAVFAPHQYDMRSWLIVSAVIVLLIALYLSGRSGEIYFLPFIFSGLLFYEYYRAGQKINKEQKKENNDIVT